MATTFVPFWNPEAYLSDLAKSGTDTVHVARLRKLHEEHPIEEVPAPVVAPKPKPVLTIEEVIKKNTISDPWKKPSATERMQSRVSKFPHINTQPLADLYAKYSKPPRMPPLEERIKVMHQCGYPEEVLMETMKRDAKMNAMSADLDNFIYAIFGDINDKKPSAPKKRTITQILKIKKRSYARPDVEDPEVDDPVSDFEDAAPEED
jgi:hypothetical protein